MLLNCLLGATDVYCRANWFNYINMTSHDPSGMLRFVTD